MNLVAQVSPDSESGLYRRLPVGDCPFSCREPAACSADFQICCIADFQVGRPSLLSSLRFMVPMHVRSGILEWANAPCQTLRLVSDTVRSVR